LQQKALAKEAIEAIRQQKGEKRRIKRFNKLLIPYYG
jgi:hypothetical protein